MTSVIDFNSSVFAFIEETYGKTISRKVKNKNNNEIVDRILEDSRSKNYSIEKTGNKLIAMLRVNP